MSSALQGANATTNNEIFYPPFFEQMGLKGFPIRHLSVKSKHTQNIKESIKLRGYDEDKPIIVAMSDDKDANGYILDGRNRLVSCYWILKETGELPAITIKHEKVKDLAHAKYAQIRYESQHLLNKPSEDAADHILTLWEEVKKLDPSVKSQQSMEQYLGKEAKIDSETTLKAIVARLSRYEKKQKDLASQVYKAGHDGSGDSDSNESWGLGTVKDETAKPSDDAEPIKSYTSEIELACSHGKKMTVGVNIFVYASGKVKVEPLT